MDLLLGIAGASIGAVVGVVHGLIVAFDEEQCCPGDLACSAVMGVSLRFIGCNPTAEYTAWGFGADDVGLAWVNDGGTPATAFTPTSNPRLTITQTVPNISVKTGIAALCSNGSVNARSFDKNLSTLSKEVYGVSLLGPTSTGLPGPVTYYLSGFDPVRYEVVSWSAWHGTILQSGSESAVVLWDENETQGEVLVSVRNICPDGNQITFLLHVEIGAGPF